jgi:hypothetical protein
MIGAGQRHSRHLSAAAEAMSWMLTESGHRTMGQWLSKLDAAVTGRRLWMPSCFGSARPG